MKNPLKNRARESRKIAEYREVGWCVNSLAGAGRGFANRELRFAIDSSTRSSMRGGTFANVLFKPNCCQEL
jgi:hypothetical protein